MKKMVKEYNAREKECMKTQQKEKMQKKQEK